MKAVTFYIEVASGLTIGEAASQVAAAKRLLEMSGDKYRLILRFNDTNVEVEDCEKCVVRTYWNLRK